MKFLSAFGACSPEHGCESQVRDDCGDCCDPEIWDNAFLEATLQDQTRSMWDERVTRGILLDLTMDREGEPNGVALLGYYLSNIVYPGRKITYDPRLPKAISRAYWNFLDLYQLARWQAYQTVVDDCTYTAWRAVDPTPNPKAQNKALADVGLDAVTFYSRMTPVMRAAILRGAHAGRTDPKWPKDYVSDGPVTSNTPLVVTPSGALVPSYWLRDLLALLAPGWDKPEQKFKGKIIPLRPVPQVTPPSGAKIAAASAAALTGGYLLVKILFL